MSTELKNEADLRPTGRSYSSIEALMRGEGVPEEVQTKVKAIRSQTRVVQHLALLRQGAGITQEEMGARMGVSQGTVSKLESGRDEDLTLGQIREYARATKERIAVGFGTPLSHVEAVKIHADGIRHHLTALADLAHGDEDMDQAIQAFFGEAFFNILHILAKCSTKMPNGVQGCEIDFQIVSETRPPKRAPRLEEGISA